MTGGGWVGGVGRHAKQPQRHWAGVHGGGVHGMWVGGRVGSVPDVDEEAVLCGAGHIVQLRRQRQGPLPHMQLR